MAGKIARIAQAVTILVPTYAANGKQYVAVLVGSRQPNNIIPQAPELKNMSTASMLYVFGL
jgi:hypothetical protein